VRLVVGRVTKAHGLRGDVLVKLDSTEVEARLAAGSTFETDRGDLVVASARPHQDRWLVSFAGVATREAADELHGLELRAEPLDDPDALWLHEVVGVRVVETSGVDRGTVVGVLPNPASDLLELEGGALVPVVFVVGWEGEGDERHLVIDPPEGLFDLG
jgi:16S rRNA processing protein RimM